MKKALLLITFFLVTLLIYKFIPFGGKETQTIANKKLVSQLADDQKSLVAKPHKKTKINQSQKFNLKTDLEQIWFENDRSIPVSSYMDELFSEVDNGNPIAKFHLSFIHMSCFNMPETEEQLNKNLSTFKLENRKQAAIDSYIYCEGYPRNKLTRDEAGKLIIEAARAGHPIAKREFIKYAFDGLMDDSTQVLQNAQRIEDLKNETFKHLLDARSMGDRGTLLTLGMVYEDGEIIEQNYVEAYAHYYAYYEVNPESSSTLLSMLERNLTQEEIDYAIEKGENYALCCN